MNEIIVTFSMHLNPTVVSFPVCHDQLVRVQELIIHRQLGNEATILQTRVAGLCTRVSTASTHDVMCGCYVRTAQYLMSSGWTQHHHTHPLANTTHHTPHTIHTARQLFVTHKHIRTHAHVQYIRTHTCTYIRTDISHMQVPCLFETLRTANTRWN